MNNWTLQLADMVVNYSYDDFPAEVLAMAESAIIDHVGLALRGTEEELTKIIAKTMLDIDIEAKDLMPGTVVGNYLPNAAAVRASSSHAIDYDDTLPPAQAAHVGASVISASFTLGAKLKCSGKALICAIVAGYEAAARVGCLVQREHYVRGFHPTSTIGGFGVAAACGKLLGFDKHQMARAFGLAGTQASGLKSVFGTMTKPFNAGNAASSGVLAAKLVEAGFTSPETILEAEKGYLDMFLGLAESEQAIAGADKFYILDNAFKFNAACHATHAMIEALKLVIAAHDFTSDQVKAVEVKVAPLGLKTASIGVPKTGLNCKFSFSQVAASVLCGLDTAADETYEDSVLDNEAVNACRAKVTTIPDDSISPFETHCKVVLDSGVEFNQYFDFVEGVLKDTEVVRQKINDKFLVSCAHLIGDATAEQLLVILKSLADSNDCWSEFAAL